MIANTKLIEQGWPASKKSYFIQDHLAEPGLSTFKMLSMQEMMESNAKFTEKMRQDAGFRAKILTQGVDWPIIDDGSDEVAPPKLKENIVISK